MGTSGQILMVGRYKYGSQEPSTHTVTALPLLNCSNIFQCPPSPPSKSVFSIPLKAVFRRRRHALVLHSHLTFHYWTFYFNIQCFPMEGSLQQCDNPFVFGSRDPQARWQNTAQYEMKRDCKFFFLQKLNTLVAS